MPQAEGTLIKHLTAPDSGAEDKVYGIDWNELDDVLRGADANKIEHLGQLRIADDTVVINSSRNLVGLNTVNQDLDPDVKGTRDLGDVTHYWDDCYFQNIYTHEIQFGGGDLGPIDIYLYRGAAHRLDLGGAGSADSFNIDNGSLMIATTTVIDVGRVIQNISSVGQDWSPDAGDSRDLGDPTNYWDDAYIDDLYVDDIHERTGGVGVTIDGVLLQDTKVIADEIILDKANQDIRLYRFAADHLRTDSIFECQELRITDCEAPCIASGCVATNLAFPTKTGAFDDNDFDCPKDGLIGIDDTLGSERIYFRAGGLWHYIDKSGPP